MKITNDLEVFGWKVLDKKYGLINDDRGTLNFSYYKELILDCIEALASGKEYIHKFNPELVKIRMSKNHDAVICEIFDENGNHVGHSNYSKKIYKDLYGPIEETIDLYFDYPVEEQ